VKAFEEEAFHRWLKKNEGAIYLQFYLLCNTVNNYASVGKRVMAERHKAADNSSIVPVSTREMPENCQNSVVRGDAGENRAIENDTFIRLTTDEFLATAIDIIKRVMLNGDRFLLQQAEKDIIAIVPEAEFHKLDYLMVELKPSQFLPEDNEYYENDRGIHCIDLEEFLDDFDNILAYVNQDDELFGLVPTLEMGEEVDILMPVAILMSVDRFWIPEYVMAERQSRK
jgi:hypothetical protein